PKDPVPKDPVPKDPVPKDPVPKDAAKADDDDASAMKLAFFSLPPQIPRFLAIPGGGQGTDAAQPLRFLASEQVLKLFIPRLFPSYRLVDAGNLRLNRDSEVEIAEEAEDLVRSYETALSRRQRGSVIRLVVNHAMPTGLRDLVMRELEMDAQDVYAANWVGYVDFMAVIPLLAELIPAAVKNYPASNLDSNLALKPESNPALNRSVPAPALQFPHFTPALPPRLRDHEGDMFAVMRAGDLLVQHPYQSFDTVIRFFDQAADDPAVLAIKLTLYRTSNDSPIVKALIKAAQNGKAVTALVEVKARFDEEANIRWAKNLEQAGAQVVYGFPALKTHAKLAMVVRREDTPDRANTPRSYVHIGTGNYHPITAKTYTDVSLFSCDPRLTRDATRIFNFIASHIQPEQLELMALSPLTLRQRLLSLIEDEIAQARAGRPAAIWLKLNALVDPEMIAALYRASQAGVDITGVIRGLCCLKPGIKDLSDRIEIRSLVGRFLEHGRIVCFGAGYGLPSAQAKLYISSADWMERNLNRRIEILVPILDETAHRIVMDDIMQHNLRDQAQSWRLQSDGQYRRLAPDDEDAFSCHNYFLGQVF
ncbi:MAG: polyphosphate kinase 1, partial [Candidatus Symbiobacter sp.]|nr:polyphosphate kinase 1 [Candidatus Symbiobacter sp.]